MNRSTAVLLCLLTGAGVFATTYPVVVVPATYTGPAYSAGYQPQQGQPSGLEEVVSLLRQLNDKMDKLIRVAEGNAEPPEPTDPPAATEPRPAELVRRAATVCAGCHQPATAADKGSGFVMFSVRADGRGLDFATLSAPAKRRVVTHLDDQTMPPPASGKQISEAERKALAEVFRVVAQPK